MHVIGDVPAAQLVVGTYSQVDSTGATPVNRCLFANYVTRHWLTGPRTYSSVGGWCRSPRGQGPPILMQGKQERGTSLVIGLAVDERIVEVQAHWLDGSISTAPVIEDTFFFFRADGVEVEWVAGIDGLGRVLSDTLAANNEVHFSPLNYVAVRQVTTGDDVFVIGAYSFTVQRQECVEVTYLTAENARRFLEGKEVFIGQQGCIINPDASDAVGPSVSTVVEGDMVVSGRPLNEAIVAVQIRWSDGLEQRVPVEDGFYFARRPDTSATVESIRGLDAGD
ncbi:MAG: hypothetical protein L0332_33695 [Chloroflexi bacterium]|nr:hypothetical protein [Chloroflexota bacterium]MCI0578774.1 hypothetical protein [Chloroflexota bacterium]MCI0648729.1 hypothetical protein [Chloroflexota bacterium]MCI0731657.1 hypothetical protein [Chloroflexota bacterium]